MARLVLCPSCSEFVLRTERICPQCDAVLVTDRNTVLNVAGAVMLGMTLAGCPADDDDDTTNTSVEPDYGVPATESDTVSTTDGMTSTSASGTMSTTASETSTVGEPEYGVPETETFTSGDTDVSTTGDTGSSGDEATSIEPD
jgi:hypothetical protein